MRKRKSNKIFWLIGFIRTVTQFRKSDISDAIDDCSNTITKDCDEDIKDTASRLVYHGIFFITFGLAWLLWPLGVLLDALNSEHDRGFEEGKNKKKLEFRQYYKENKKHIKR